MITKLRFLIPIVFVFAACQSTDTLSGDLLLWYADDESTELVLNSMLAEFEEREPNVHVVAVPIPADELATRFAEAAQQGLGADVVLASAENIYAYAAADLIEPLPADALHENVLPQAVSAVQFQQQPYGAPLAVNPLVLYYNTKRIPTPAVTLNEWLAQAEEGSYLLIPNQFDTLFWGVSTFGSGLMDANGQLVLHPNALLAWIDWLKTAQNEGDLIISRDVPLLEERFLMGDAGYLTAPPNFLPRATAALTDTIGIATLPAGGASSGSLLNVEAFMINRHSTPAQRAIGEQVIRFLTNAEQSAVWLRETGRVPAHQDTHIDPRLYPLLAIVAAEARFGVYYTADIDIVAFKQAGDTLFADVLSGATEPEQAVCDFGRFLTTNYADRIDTTIWEAVCVTGGDS